MLPVIPPLFIQPLPETGYKNEQEIFEQMEADLKRCKRSNRYASRLMARIKQCVRRGHEMGPAGPLKETGIG